MKAGGALPVASGEVIVQGEDLGAWVAAQRLGWDKLLPAQQWLLESTLGLEPAGADERPPARRSQSAAWARDIAAARQFQSREGHLVVPCKHLEDLDGEPVGLGQFVNNARRRATTLSPQRRTDLDELGMRCEGERVGQKCGLGAAVPNAPGTDPLSTWGTWCVFPQARCARRMDAYGWLKCRGRDGIARLSSSCPASCPGWATMPVTVRA
ncbi:helicase associated domain-containing protein [Streptomyces spiralis]